jgi:hypothetical protein
MSLRSEPTARLSGGIPATYCLTINSGELFTEPCGFQLLELLFTVNQHLK